VTYKRKLIEVALPLEAINRESAREKEPFTRNHPRSLHIWWARRPLAACRAVLFSQLVDDPSAHPDRFPSEEDQALERKRLFYLLERLVVWENATDEQLLREAHAEIASCFDGSPPAVLDPFAGGGSIPLEAQRLGLQAHASDLNPVAVLINKALIEIPPRWADQPPVYPDAAESRMGGWPRATGLAEDVRRYGAWMRNEAEKRIGHLYPRAALHDGSQATVIAWMWARTVTCPNPACGATMPLISTLWLSKKKNRPTWLRPVIEGRSVRFEIATAASGPPAPPKQGRGAKFACLVCGDVTSDTYIRAAGMGGRMGQQLVAVVAEGNRRRVYLPATPEHMDAAAVSRPDEVPDGAMPDNPRWFSPPAFGITDWSDLFTNRQLVALTTFSDLVGEARARVAVDATSGKSRDAAAYADAVATILGLTVSRYADLSNAFCSWNATNENVRALFARQAIPMTWDFVETNVFGSISMAGPVAAAEAALIGMRHNGDGHATQADAASQQVQEVVISTDPPYYDNIGYADLSDFFYVWLRRSLQDVYPKLLSTMQTPKSDELVATPYRFGGSRAKAEEHFEAGLIRTFIQIREGHPHDVPVTVFYAFKQAEDDDGGSASTGWETMLNGLIEAGLTVTATWPMRTERAARAIGIGANALASSIVLACRPREATAEATTRRGFLQALKDELPRALREMQQGSLAPVDLAQAAIGPGMAVFTRYRSVLEADGSAMTVRTALALINHALDEVLSEQEGDFSPDTRFCVKWFSQFGWDEQPYGVAESLSKAVATSVDGLVRGGVFWARAGKARLVSVNELSANWDPLTDDRISEWEVVVRLARALEREGVYEAARLMRRAGQRVDLDSTKELAYLLYSVCERKGWTSSAALFNGLGTSWSDLTTARRSASNGAGTQGAFNMSGADDEEA
jgi:putative DNA methylase